MTRTIDLEDLVLGTPCCFCSPRLAACMCLSMLRFDFLVQYKCSASHQLSHLVVPLDARRCLQTYMHVSTYIFYMFNVHVSENCHDVFQMLSSRLSLHRVLPTLARSCHGQVQEASFDYPNYKLHRLDDGPPTSTTITRDESLRLYREMVCIRRLETASANLYKEKAIRGFCHLCSGQEAVYSGNTGQRF